MNVTEILILILKLSSISNTSCVSKGLKGININLLAIRANHDSLRVSSSQYCFAGRKIKYYKGLHISAIPFWGGFFLPVTRENWAD
jgi:hypothetical protein